MFTEGRVLVDIAGIDDERRVISNNTVNVHESSNKD
jgi:hypothetical protein